MYIERDAWKGVETGSIRVAWWMNNSMFMRKSITIAKLIHCAVFERPSRNVTIVASKDNWNFMQSHMCALHLHVHIYVIYVYILKKWRSICIFGRWHFNDGKTTAQNEADIWCHRKMICASVSWLCLSTFSHSYEFVWKVL